MVHSGRSAQVPILREELQGSNSKGSSDSPSCVARGSSQNPYSTTAVSLLDLYRIPTGSQQDPNRITILAVWIL